MMRNIDETARKHHETGQKGVETPPPLPPLLRKYPPRKKDFLTRYVAEKLGYSISMVSQVRAGTKNNDEIMAALVEARQKFGEVLKS